MCQSCYSAHNFYICGACRQREFRRKFIDSRNPRDWLLEQRANMRRHATFYKVSVS